MALVAFRRLQIGLEGSGSQGTEVAADTVLIGELTMTPEVIWHRPRDARDSLAEFKRSVATAHNNTMRYTGDATYEQIMQFLSMTLKGAVVGVQVDATSAYEWTYTPTLGASNAHDSYTFEYGDGTNMFTATFVKCLSMELGIAAGEVLTLNADLVGRFPEEKAATSSLTDETVTEIIAAQGKFYIDTTWANVGNTEKASSLVGGTIRFNSGLTPVRYVNGLDTLGLATLSTFTENPRSHSIDLDIIASADMINEVYDAYKDGTNRAIRIVFDAATDSIESGHNHELEIDMFGRFSSPPELFGDADGENMFRITLTSHDDGSGNEIQVRVKTTTTAI